MKLLLALFLIILVIHMLVKGYISDYKRVHTPEAEVYHKKRLDKMIKTGKDIWL